MPEPSRATDPHSNWSRRESAALNAQIETVGVTGTNGKTTTTSMLAAIVAASGQVPSRVTTVGSWVGSRRREVEVDFASFLDTAAHAIRAGSTTLAVEMTSRALAAGFARRWPARVGVFTNLTRDHLDRHGSPEAYLSAKAELFALLPRGGTAVLNASDEASALLERILPTGVRCVTYADTTAPRCTAASPTLAASGVRCDRDGVTIALEPTGLGARLGPTLSLRVLGRVHAENALAAATAADALGLPVSAIREGLELFTGVPGRFEVVARDPLVVVDYAHTPSALSGTLETARELVRPGGRVLCVFGCGGERDEGKRPMMGRIADELADRVLVTSDNPRGEDPARIAWMVEEGALGRATLDRELDRPRAIDRAVREARPGDVVIVAGRGHERVQDLGAEKRALSDVAEATAACLRHGVPLAAPSPARAPSGAP
jgi:UDP-N-acetylmuramoyl-L-alanyl-D-glutamate--2,6-diaminopimelate ligase